MGMWTASPDGRGVALRCLIVTALGASVLLLGDRALLAQENVDSQPGEEQPAPAPEDQDEPETYSGSERVFGNPTDIEQDLEGSLPKRDSVLPQLKPQGWANLKGKLYKNHGLMLGLSYQALVQHASRSVTDQDTAAGGWVLLEAKWEAIRRDRDFEGSIVMGVDGRHTLGGNAVPGIFRLDTGSLWATDTGWFEWDPYVAVLFWEQWFKKDRFVLRLGQLGSIAVLDFFRFGDFRTSFSNSQLSNPAALIPFGPPGPGVSFKWWPTAGPDPSAPPEEPEEEQAAHPDAMPQQTSARSELYVVGTVTDINAPVGEWDWSRLTEYGQIFAGAEIGMNWRRGEGDFDHAHLTLWYGDKKDTAPYLTDSGWGFKVHGSKQWGSWVGFANYGYNNAYGGGFGFTNARQAVNAGFGYQKPLGINGEIAMALSWAEPLDRPDPILGIESDRNQYGLEANWKILLTPDLWITPGVQLIWEPTFNPSTDFVAIPQLKFRAFF